MLLSNAATTAVVDHRVRCPTAATTGRKNGVLLLLLVTMTMSLSFLLRAATAVSGSQTTNSPSHSHRRDASDKDQGNDVIDTDSVVGRYARYDEILSWQQSLCEQHPDIVQLIDIGASYEGRPMRVIKMSTGGSREKWSVWLDGGIHAREHITPATVIYIADLLLKSYVSGNTHSSWMLNHVDWYLLPVINPDGYEYSLTRDRSWRKNRRPINRNCTGVDLNRNWKIGWGEADSASSPCSDVYIGEEPESEPEVVNIVEFLLPRAHQFVGFVTYHSYGERILTQWSQLEDPPADNDELTFVATKMSLAMQQSSGTSYDSGSASELTYVFGGGSADWARTVAGIRYTFLIELRDTGEHGFMLPVDQIEPTAVENWAGLRELVAHVLLNNGLGPETPDQDSDSSDLHGSHAFALKLGDDEVEASRTCRDGDHSPAAAAAAAVHSGAVSSGRTTIMLCVLFGGVSLFINCIYSAARVQLTF